MKGTWSTIIVVLVVTALFFTGPGPVRAASPADETESVEIGKVIRIQSKILGEERPILVYVPGDYVYSGASYPVLYLLDGSYHFHHATGIIDFLSKLSRIPRMILVGIHNIDRNRDFLPTRVDDFPPVAGADKFLAFLREELVPYVDEHYRTVPYRILCGHSFGGLFGVYSMVNDPELFQAYFIVSPSVYWDDRLMFKKTEELFREKPGLKRFFYITAAGGDKDAIRFASKDFAGFLEKKAPKGFEWHYRFMEKEDHNSTFHRVFYNALESLYPDWWLSWSRLSGMSLSDIREHYKKLSVKYGYEIPVQERAIDNKEYLLRKENKIDEAIEVLKFKVAEFPNSARAYFKLGRAYDYVGKLDLAKTNFEMAVRLGERNKDPLLPTFKEFLSLLLNKMK